MTVLGVAATVSLASLAVSFLLVLFRLWRGPTRADRVVALDLAGALSVGFIVVDSSRWGEGSVLDVAMAIGLLSFLGTTAFATYLEREMEQ